MAHPILVYGDSLSWGIIPNTRQRHPFDVRWPGLMESELARAGHAVRVIEDCLNGRRTVWDDPFKPGRNGSIGLEQRVEVNMPLSLIILMLGSNDFQSMHPHNAWHSAQGMAALVNTIRRAPIEPGMHLPEILIVAPPLTQTPQGDLAPKFEGAAGKSVGLDEAYQQVAGALGCHFFNAGLVTHVSPVDGIHLDADQQQRLGRELAKFVSEILPRG
jgi:lysophospholipase L1-like esterase